MRGFSSLTLVATTVTLAVGAGSFRAATAERRAESLYRGSRQATACDDLPGFHKLDYWVGNWNVFVGDRQVGTNRIAKILTGCAVEERWVDMAGNQGRSLFYYNPIADTWKQVWVTARATATGGLKEKTLIAELDGGALRFQGEIPLPDGRSYLDRTTLTPLADGRVRQVIETSRDAGRTWQVGFDAVYIARTDAGQEPPGITELRAAYVRAYDAGDASAMEDLYAADAVRMPYDAPEQDGRDAVLVYYRRAFSSRRLQPTLRLIAHAVETRGEIVMERGAYVEVLTPPSGGSSRTERGKYVTLARRGEDGRWRYVWSIFNRDAAPKRGGG